MPTAGQQPHPGAVAAHHHAEPVVLDFVQGYSRRQLLANAAIAASRVAA